MQIKPAKILINSESSANYPFLLLKNSFSKTCKENECVKATPAGAAFNSKNEEPYSQWSTGQPGPMKKGMAFKRENPGGFISAKGSQGRKRCFYAITFKLPSK
uniref:Uncharacterized protein n=1 Tax=Romanomermis culicivorax TaxID=13658 RepID=A0A915KBT7_ROMCU